MICCTHTRHDLLSPHCRLTHDDSNLSDATYSDPDTEFHEFQEDYMNPTTVWDRGKLSNRPSATPDDLNCLKRLESSVTNLESFLESLPNQETSLTSNTRSLSLICPSPPFDDTLSDVDLDKFDNSKSLRRESRLESISSAIDRAETASLSNFHNVRDVLLNIKGRLESYLTASKGNNSDDLSQANLEGNIADLKRELERYVRIINEKKESELRKFSENMTNHSNILQMKKAFQRKQKLQTNIYETLATRYAIPDSDSMHSERVCDGFTMRSCYDSDYVCQTYSDFSSVEYYTMLINEEKSEKLLNDAPQPRYHDREKISLIFRDPQHVIKQWQNYQLNTIQIKPKKPKSLKLNWPKRHKYKPHDIWAFTLDYHENQTLQRKLEKERRLRLMCRLFFGFFSVVCFVLTVLTVQSMFTFKKRGVSG